MLMKSLSFCGITKSVQYQSLSEVTLGKLDTEEHEQCRQKHLLVKQNKYITGMNNQNCNNIRSIIFRYLCLFVIYNFPDFYT